MRGQAASLVTAEQSTTRPDPCTALAAHEQEVGAASRCIPTSRSRRDDLHHQLAGALVNIAGIPVGPDMGSGLGAHLNDVITQGAAGEGKGISPAKHILPCIAVHFRRAPLPVGELGTGAVCITCAQKFDSCETLPRHVGVAGRQNDLEAAQRGVLAAAVHDWRGDRCKSEGAGAGGALRRWRRQLRLRTRGQNQGDRQQDSETGGERRREPCQGGGGGGADIS